jgi:hypothetical protein
MCKRGIVGLLAILLGWILMVDHFVLSRDKG